MSLRCKDAFYGGTDAALQVTSGYPSGSAYPRTCAAWVKPTGGSAGTNVSNRIFQLGGISASPSNYFALSCSDRGTGIPDEIFARSHNGVTSADALVQWPSGFEYTGLRWYFVMGRFLSATFREVLGVDLFGNKVSTTSSTSNTPTLNGTAAIGANGVTFNGSMDGCIAEFWHSEADVTGDATALDANILRRFAFQGPCWHEGIMAKMVEYQSFRAYAGPDLRSDRDSFTGIYGKINYTAFTSNPTFGDNPPLPYWYQRPSQRKTILPV